MTLAVQILNGRVVGVFVGYEECALDLAAIWILALSIEDLFIQIDVVNINGTVECQCDHLWYLRWFNVAGNSGSI